MFMLYLILCTLILAVVCSKTFNAVFEQFTYPLPVPSGMHGMPSNVALIPINYSYNIAFVNLS